MSAMIQGYGRVAGFVVFHSISPRVECEDFPRGECWFHKLRKNPLFFDR